MLHHTANNTGNVIYIIYIDNIPTDYTNIPIIYDR
jgi:hypothetical protein